MFFPQFYKFELNETSSDNRFGEFVIKNNMAIMPISEDEDALALLTSSLDSLHYTITKKELNNNDMIEITNNVELIIKLLISNIPIVDEFFSNFNNDQLLLDVFDKSQDHATKFATDLLYFIFKSKKLIKDPSIFTGIFLQDFFELTEFDNSEQTYKLFEILTTNLVLNFDIEKDQFFNKNLLDHLSNVIKINAKLNENIIPLIYYYCRLVQNFNNTDYDDILIDEDFYDFMEEFIKSLDFTNISVRYSVIRLLVSLSKLDFFEWLFQEEYIKITANLLIQYSHNDDYLFILLLYLIRINSDFVLFIKDPLYNIVLEKCQQLIEIRKWGNNENLMAKKITRSFHYFYKYGEIISDESCEHKMTILVFLINLLDKSIYSIKCKSLLFISVFIQSLLDIELSSEMMNLIANVFIKSIDLDTVDSKFLLFTSFLSLFHRMQTSKIFDEFKSTFIENRVIESLRDAIQTQSFDEETYIMSKEILGILLEGFEEEEDFY